MGRKRHISRRGGRLKGEEQLKQYETILDLLAREQRHLKKKVSPLEFRMLQCSFAQKYLEATALSDNARVIASTILEYFLKVEVDKAENRIVKTVEMVKRMVNVVINENQKLDERRQFDNAFTEGANAAADALRKGFNDASKKVDTY